MPPGSPNPDPGPVTGRAYKWGGGGGGGGGDDGGL